MYQGNPLGVRKKKSIVGFHPQLKTQPPPLNQTSKKELKKNGNIQGGQSPAGKARVKRIIKRGEWRCFFKRGTKRERTEAVNQDTQHQTTRLITRGTYGREVGKKTQRKNGDK